MVPFMCVKLSPCCDTVTPLAASEAISRSSFIILFVSAIVRARSNRHGVEICVDSQSRVDPLDAFSSALARVRDASRASRGRRRARRDRRDHASTRDGRRANANRERDERVGENAREVSTPRARATRDGGETVDSRARRGE